MTITEKKLHKFLINIIMSILVWFLINLYIFKIFFWQFIIIEIFIAIGEIFSNFIKEKLKLNKEFNKPTNDRTK